MTITVDLDDDVYELASAYASTLGITLGSAIAELIRASQAPPRIVIGENGLPFIPASGRTLTMEMVRAAEEDELG